MSTKKPELSLIFPVHNEEEGIEAFIKNVYKALNNQIASFEILCIENGSTDNSLKILKELAKVHEEIFVFTSDKGWGNAVREGIRRARGEYVCYMVSDGQVEPVYIPQLFKLIKEDNVALAKICRITRENMTRLINSRVYNMISSLLFGLRTIDINGTPKIIKTSLAREMHLSSENIALDLELLLKLKSRSLHLAEIPIQSKKRSFGVSTTNIRSIVEMVSHMILFRIFHL